VGWEPLVRLKPHECEPIIAALAVKGHAAAKAIAEVQQAIATYHALVQDERIKVSKREAKKALMALAARPDAEILAAVNALPDSARKILELKYCDLATKAQLPFALDFFSRFKPVRRSISRSAYETLRRAAREYQPKGRSRNDLEGILVNLLLPTWREFQPDLGLRVVDGETGWETGRFREFVEACFKAAQIKTSPTRAIRRVYDGTLLIRKRNTSYQKH